MTANPTRYENKRCIKLRAFTVIHPIGIAMSPVNPKAAIECCSAQLAYMQWHGNHAIFLHGESGMFRSYLKDSQFADHARHSA